jgi:hypothetical protein
MKPLQPVVLAALLLTSVASHAADSKTARTNAQEETRRALDAYREGLEQELRQLDNWAKSVPPPGGDKLREERAVAEQTLRRLGDEAKRVWNDLRSRMDAVVDDVKRGHQAAGREQPRSMPLVTPETIVGTWSGRWRAADGTRDGALGLVVARVPGQDTVVGQFTFMRGAVSQTLRYEGRLHNGAVRFPLVGEGRIVLEAGPDAQRPTIADQLTGTWIEDRGALPAARGSIELQRAT